uniref:Uncharacterized protein n=1 Tax=Candidatus Kentrum sp. FW TaxID=2126338 RepID=A0A450SDE3_9GAMM|nr:MAG: hypothetical protein BECKFW1821B_GA0114236_100716 [Candidatus Kentron sp. FW]
MEEQRRPIGRLFFDHNPNHNSDHNHEVRVTYYPSISTFLGCLAIDPYSMENHSPNRINYALSV